MQGNHICRAEQFLEAVTALNPALGEPLIISGAAVGDNVHEQTFGPLGNLLSDLSKPHNSQGLAGEFHTGYAGPSARFHPGHDMGNVAC